MNNEKADYGSMANHPHKRLGRKSPKRRGNRVRVSGGVPSSTGKNGNLPPVTNSNARGAVLRKQGTRMVPASAPAPGAGGGKEKVPGKGYKKILRKFAVSALVLGAAYVVGESAAVLTVLKALEKG